MDIARLHYASIAEKMNYTLDFNNVHLDFKETVINTTDIEKDATNTATLADHVYISIGMFMVFVFVCGFLENGGVLYIYIKNKKLWTCRNAFLVGLAVGDLGQSILNIPFVMVSAFSKRWLFGYHMCQYYGFITSMFGLTQITILSIVALDRYFLIVRHHKSFSVTTKTTICTILLCFLHGALWSLGPLLGWSQYIVDPGEISCGIDWNLQSMNNLSFVVSLFIFLWFIPLGIIIFSYFSIAWLVVNERKKKKTLKSTQTRKKASKERRVALTCLIVTGLFIMSWTPYSIVSFWTAFDHIDNIPLLLQMSTAFFAKSSIIWNPVIYFVRHDNFRSACVDSLPCVRWWLGYQTNRKKRNNSSDIITTIHNQTVNKTELSTDIRTALMETCDPNRETTL